MNNNNGNPLNSSPDIFNISPERPRYFFSPTYRLTGWLGRTCEWIESPSRYCEIGRNKEGILKVILIILKICASLGDGISFVVHRIAAEEIKDYDQQFDDFAGKCMGPLAQHSHLKRNVGEFIDCCIIHRLSPTMFAEGQELLFLSDNAEALRYLGNQPDGYYFGYFDKKFKNNENYKCLCVHSFPGEREKTNKEFRDHYETDGKHLALGNKVYAMSFINIDLKNMDYSKSNIDYIKNQFNEFDQINPAEVLLNKS